MDLKFKQFAELIFISESKSLLESFAQHEPALKGMYIEYLEMEAEERDGFIAARLETAQQWQDEMNDSIDKIVGDK